MKERLRQLEKVVHVRAVLEKLAEAGLLRSKAELSRCDHHIETVLSQAKTAAGDVFTAMASPANEVRALANGLRLLAERRLPELERKRAVCFEVAERQRHALLERSLEAERAALLFRSTCDEASRELDRREQSISDDRFAARQRWTREH